MDDGNPVYVEIEQTTADPQLISNKSGEVAQAQGKFTDEINEDLPPSM